MFAWRHLPGFAPAEELAHLRHVIERNRHRFGRTRERAGLGPNCLRINGDVVRDHLPDLVDYGERHVRPVVEAIAGRALQPAIDAKRSIRVQAFASPEDDFRWHFDISRFAALLTIDNDNGSETQLVPSRVSRIVRRGYFLLGWLPQLVSLLPHESLATGPGDLLVIAGTEVLHRGVAHGEGERTIVVYTYDDRDAQPNPLRVRLARYLNRGY